MDAVLHSLNFILFFAGCGNSTLSEDMYLDGYHYIVNLDYSSVVLKKMKARSEICSAMEWIVMDIRTMNFSDKSFDVIIEKGTLDALMVDEKDPWNIGKDTTEMLDNIFKQVTMIYLLY